MAAACRRSSCASACNACPLPAEPGAAHGCLLQAAYPARSSQEHLHGCRRASPKELHICTCPVVVMPGPTHILLTPLAIALLQQRLGCRHGRVQDAWLDCWPSPAPVPLQLRCGHARVCSSAAPARLGAPWRWLSHRSAGQGRRATGSQDRLHVGIQGCSCASSAKLWFSQQEGGR
jgi:hypothetical protein